jgi:hypothetical protein
MSSKAKTGVFQAAAIDHLFPPYTKEKVQALNQWSDY